VAVVTLAAPPRFRSALRSPSPFRGGPRPASGTRLAGSAIVGVAAYRPGDTEGASSTASSARTWRPSCERLLPFSCKRRLLAELRWAPHGGAGGAARPHAPVGPRAAAPPALSPWLREREE